MRRFALEKNKQSNNAPQTDPQQSKALSPWPPTGSLQNDGTAAQRMSGPPLPSVQKKRHLCTLQGQDQGTGGEEPLQHLTIGSSFMECRQGPCIGWLGLLFLSVGCLGALTPLSHC